jgi:glycosyltransferase involved in cell wall biosynthesis
MKRKIVSIYRGKLSLNRGTPLRVASLINEIVKNEDFEYFTCTADDIFETSKSHLTISGKKIHSIKEINTFVKTNNIDVLIFHTLSAAYFLLPLKILNPRKKFVLEMHGFNEEEERLYSDISLYKFYLLKIFFGIIYICSDAITTCSETASIILRKYNSNVTTVYGGVDLHKFNPNIVPTHSFKSAEEEIVIGYSGNLRKWQGVDFLVDVFQELTKRDKLFKLVLLLSEKVTIDIPENVTVLDPVSHDEVGKYNASFDILVIPRPETKVNTISFPSKLIEYMAMGKPVIGSRTSDIHKIVIDGKNGFLYDPEDKEGLINCFLKLKDPHVRASIGKSAFETVQQEYTWKHQGEKVSIVLRSL